MKPSQIVATYFLVQAVGTAAWWVLLLAFPPSVSWFQPSDWPADSLRAFWLADFVLIVGGSVVAATGVCWRTSWATTCVWAVAAVTWYPTLFCIATSILTNEAWIASSIMTSMASLSLAMATIQGTASQRPTTIRPTSLTRISALLWTIGQTAMFWGLFLWLLPMGLMELEDHVGWHRFQHRLQAPLSAGVLIAASGLGLWSAVSMAIHGRGTPLPTATAPRLVTVGPYRFVRNPMAVAGILQGLAVGWYLGSILVAAYSLTGAVLWHFFVRPVEERDLVQRFGAEYRQYRQQVRLWLPRFTTQRAGA